jgi:NAD-dependent deacetylase
VSSRLLPPAEDLARAAALLGAAQRIVAFTGAGVSTESGIPDFRSPGGIWARYTPVLYHEFLSDAEARRRYWRMQRELYPTLAAAEPNAAHRALATLLAMGKLDCIITQNIDGLHQRAGCPPDRVIELHGNGTRVGCLQCHRTQPRAAVQPRLEAGEDDLRCQACGGLLKPTTVAFGQPMPEREMREAQHRAALCDLMLVIGSTLVVYPAADVPLYALAAGARLVIINLTETPLDDRADVVLRGHAGPTMEALLAALGAPDGERVPFA